MKKSLHVVLTHSWLNIDFVELLVIEVFFGIVCICFQGLTHLGLIDFIGSLVSAVIKVQ